MLEWLVNGYKLIKNPVVKNKKNVKYFLIIEIDENDDGLICSNDYIQDYDRTEFFSFNKMPLGVIDIYVDNAEDRAYCK